MENRFKPTVIESPYAGAVDLNRAYLQACIRDCIARGETPYASQMLTSALDDEDPIQRAVGIEAGLQMREALVRGCSARVAFYVDLGWSSGMLSAQERAVLEETLYETRSIPALEWRTVLREVRESGGKNRFVLENLEAIRVDEFREGLASADLAMALKEVLGKT